MSPPQPGSARSPGISYQELLDTDTHPVPEVLRLESPRYLGSGDIDTARYISREWHEREARTLWRSVWQFACRADDIPEVGDHVLYEIVRDSYIVIRTAPDEIKAYPNACLHRGRRLKEYAGRCSEIRCPFHGFAWTLDGALKHVPARWDFEHVRDEEFSLPECKVGTWAGFVMINPDPDAEPLEDFLGEITEQFDVWDLASRYTQAHVAKVIHANWKIAQEAFCEAFHVNATHPQIAPYLGDTNTQVDIWGELRPGHHPRRHSEPAAGLDPHPGRHDAGHDRHPGRRAHADSGVRGPVDEGYGSGRQPGPVAAGGRRVGRPDVPTPR